MATSRLTFDVQIKGLTPTQLAALADNFKLTDVTVHQSRGAIPVVSTATKRQSKRKTTAQTQFLLPGTRPEEGTQRFQIWRAAEYLSRNDRGQPIRRLRVQRRAVDQYKVKASSVQAQVNQMIKKGQLKLASSPA